MSSRGTTFVARLKTARSLPILIIILFILPASHGRTVECPPAPNQVNIHVQSEVRFHPDTRTFQYRYSVTNRPDSTLRVQTFAVQFVPPIRQILFARQSWSSPSRVEWTHRTTAVPRPGDPLFEATGPDVIQWGSAGDPDTSSDLPQARGAYPVTGDIEPGETVEFFGFTTPHPPGFSAYYALGMVAMPAGLSEQEAERVGRLCDDSLVGGFFDRAKKGPTVGPGRELKVDIDIKPGSNPNRFNPDATGVVSVALLGSDTFSVSRASDTQALFGITMTEPMAPGEVKDVNRDGHEDLLFHFPILETGIDEKHDTAALAVALTDPLERADTTVTVVWGTDSLRGWASPESSPGDGDEAS